MLPFEFPLFFQIQCAFLASLDAWSMLRFHIPLPTDLSVFRRLYFGIDFLPALCNVFSSVAILGAVAIIRQSDSPTNALFL